jgi:hypothetical protein
MPGMNEVEDSVRESDATFLPLAPPSRLGAGDDLPTGIEGRSRLRSQSLFSTEGRRCTVRSTLNGKWNVWS